MMRECLGRRTKGKGEKGGQAQAVNLQLSSSDIHQISRLPYPLLRVPRNVLTRAFSICQRAG